MAKVTTYSVRFDGRTKEIILFALSNLHQQTEQEISAQTGEVDEYLLQRYDEIGQVRRGILMSPAEEIDTDDLETTNSETIDE